MTITREHGLLIFECDLCGDTEEDDTLQAELTFDDRRAGCRAYDMLSREELTGVSSRLEINGFTIHDADGHRFGDDEAFSRQDDYSLILVAQRSTLVEVSLCLTPVDPRYRCGSLAYDQAGRASVAADLAPRARRCRRRLLSTHPSRSEADPFRRSGNVAGSA